ncbi:MAG: FkbM family methyltransferase, partial [Saprospiraceae bacterium]
MTIPMALAAGKDGLCLAFDPNPIVFKILSQNAGLNPEVAHIVPYNVAITDTSSSFYYHSSEASFNNGGISPTKESRHGKYVLPDQIKGVHLETLLQEKHPDYAQKLKLIKIDTEGYDKEIAKSIKSILVTCKPILISECFGKMPTADKYEYYDFLTGLGYQLYYFSDFVSDAEIIQIHKKEDMLRWKHFDFYAVHTAQ